MKKETKGPLATDDVIKQISYVFQLYHASVLLSKCERATFGTWKTRTEGAVHPPDLLHTGTHTVYAVQTTQRNTGPRTAKSTSSV
jgi:hypothetical protein